MRAGLFAVENVDAGRLPTAHTNEHAASQRGGRVQRMANEPGAAEGGAPFPARTAGTAVNASTAARNGSPNRQRKAHGREMHAAVSTPLPDASSSEASVSRRCSHDLPRFRNGSSGCTPANQSSQARVSQDSGKIEQQLMMHLNGKRRLVAQQGLVQVGKLACHSESATSEAQQRGRSSKHTHSPARRIR